MSFSDWFSAVGSSVPLALLTLITLAVVFVNGWTDAPNAIASCIATRALAPSVAIGMASVCNLLGLAVSVTVNRTVTDTVMSMVNFGDRSRIAEIALCAGLGAVVLWAVLAWYFGIPTSESHALLAGISGAALAVGGAGGIRLSAWTRVLFGLFLSVLLGGSLGFLFARWFFLLFAKKNRRRTERAFRSVQILGGGLNAFLHGAQDGQKFIGVLLLSVAGGTVTEIPLWSVALCSSVLFFGTCLGGKRIIRTVGMKMVRPQSYQGVAADFASAASLFVCTCFGLPVSTTHVKTTALMGAGAEVRLRSVNWSVAAGMFVAWVVTFPGCGLLGYFTARLLLRLFV